MNKPKQFSSNGIKTFSQHTEARTKLQPFPLVEPWVWGEGAEAIWACYQEGKKALWEGGPRMFPSWLPSAFPSHFWAMVLGKVGRTVKSPYKNTFIVFACFYQHKFILDRKIWVQIQPFISQPWTFEYSVHCNWVWGNTNDNRPTHSNYFPTLLVTRGLKKVCFGKFSFKIGWFPDCHGGGMGWYTYIRRLTPVNTSYISPITNSEQAEIMKSPQNELYCFNFHVSSQLGSHDTFWGILFSTCLVRHSDMNNGETSDCAPAQFSFDVRYSPGRLISWSWWAQQKEGKIHGWNYATFLRQRAGHRVHFKTD